MNSQFSMDLIPNYLLPFDWENYNKYTGKAYAVATNIVTGKAEYLSMKKMPEGLKNVQASTALPLVFQTVEIDGKLFLDGGISDAIPIQKSILDGNKKNCSLEQSVGWSAEHPDGQDHADAPGRILRSEEGGKVPDAAEFPLPNRVSGNTQAWNPSFLRTASGRQGHFRGSFLPFPHIAAGVGSIKTTDSS